MAAVEQHHWYSLSTHRPWEDVVSMILGLVVLASPIFLGDPGATAISMSIGVTGLLIVVLGMLETISLRRWEEWLEGLCGLWLVASPYVLGYAGTYRWLHVVIGLLVVALAMIELWQDRDRKMEG